MIVFQKPFPGAARAELESQLQRAVKVSAKGKRVKCKIDLERCLFWNPAGKLCRAQANPRGYVSQIPITLILASPSQASNALHGWLRASSALGTATPVASPGSRGCVCRRRLGGNRGLGNHFLTSGLVCRNLEHAGHAGSMALPCQAWTAVPLAQLALLQATHSHIGGGHYSFSVPSGTDNSATEASLNKMFTTSWPLQPFVQLTAFWAHARNVLLQPTHVPGRSNDWAAT